MIFNRLGLILNREVRRGAAPSKTPLPPLLRKERGTQGVRLFHKNQMGFTLTELMLAIAIAGIITGGITTTIFSVVNGSARTSNHMTAVRQVQNAGYWVSRDTQMAQSVTLSASSGFPLILAWTDWDGKSNTAVYSLENMSVGTLKQLKRTFSKTGDATKTGIIAQFIDPTTKCEAGGTFTLPDKDDTFTITGGAVADSGKITVATGSISVTTAGGATYSASTGTWTTPPASGTVVVKAKVASTAGGWTSTTASARVAITADTDGDATITGGVLTFTVTTSVGTGSQQQSETRIYEVIPRPGS